MRVFPRRAMTGAVVVAHLCLLAGLLLPEAAHAFQAHATADVVVIVDTSTSMKEPAMDPKGTSVLVAKLLSDIVPGDLAVVRLLDLRKDKNLLPSELTGRYIPCSEVPTNQCPEVRATNDWYSNTRRDKFGALIRPARGDPGFKEQLNTHLSPDINNSIFGLAFRGAQGVFDSHGNSQVHRTVVWLSDGNTTDPPELAEAVSELNAAGVVIQPVVFGEGKVDLAANMGLAPKRVRTPAELIKAFADSFREIVRAPYELDNTIAAEPAFDMKPRVDEAWIVVYGDDTLGDVVVDGPDGPHPATYAHDRKPGAGAYRVLYLEHPAAGRWTVRATGGGAAAYAVIQRSGLVPVILEPQTALVGVPVPLVAGIKPSSGEGVLGPGDLPGDITLEAEIEGQRIRLNDDGSNGDAAAHDGRYSATFTFQNIGKVPVTVRLKSQLLDAAVTGEVNVTGMFRAAGRPVEIDLGRFNAPGESCREFRVEGEHRGVLPFEIAGARSLPGGHKFQVRQSRGAFTVGQKMPLGPGESLQLCLVTSSWASDSTAGGEHWLDLRVANSSAADATVPIYVRWNLTGLTWWQRWRWLIISLLVLICLIIWIYGYIRPVRFPRSLALTFVTERAEVDEQTAQPIAQWSGVGIGWYRNARACLHPSFRVNGNPAGAVAVLNAISGGTQVQPGNGGSLYRETLEGTWEPISAEGRRISSGEVYRVGEAGPYFRVSVRKL